MVSMRILFVDDDFITIESLVSHLQLSGHVVEVADDVNDAINRLMSKCYDLVVLDVMLPCGDHFDLGETSDGRYTGLRILELIRTDVRFLNANGVRVVLATNWREEPQVDSVASRHNAEVLRKPLSIAVFDGVCGT